MNNKTIKKKNGLLKGKQLKKQNRAHELGEGISGISIFIHLPLRYSFPFPYGYEPKVKN
jgi:hypothetical protein